MMSLENKNFWKLAWLVRKPSHFGIPVLREFVDAESNVVGIYALGHYHHRDFLKVVKLKYPQIASLNRKPQHFWLNITHHHPEAVFYFEPGNTPVTVLQLCSDFDGAVLLEQFE